MNEPGRATQPVLGRSDEAGVVTLQLNRPNSMNCLSEELLAALEVEFLRISEDAQVKCVVISGSGRAFCAGHDLKDMRQNATLEYYRSLFALCSRVMMSIRATPVPVIAKVHGDATAAGCQLVAACDLAIASTKARFAAAGINLGSFCATPAVAITRAIPARHAFNMLFTGRFFDAKTVAQWGLVNEVVAHEELDQAVATLANEIASKSGVALRFGKSQFYQQREMELADAYGFATDGIAVSLMGKDAQEGIDAFLSKRNPVWSY
ncbi:enoyl-CoA hydratase [Cupriavidus necator]